MDGWPSVLLPLKHVQVNVSFSDYELPEERGLINLLVRVKYLVYKLCKCFCIHEDKVSVWREVERGVPQSDV